MKTSEKVTIKGIEFDVDEVKPFINKKMQWHVYVSKDGKKFLTTKIGPSFFTDTTPINTTN